MESEPSQVSVPDGVVHNRDRGSAKVPSGIENILAFLYRETIREQPPDVVPFIAKLLAERLEARTSQEKDGRAPHLLIAVIWLLP